MLTVQNLSIGYKGKAIAESINLHLEKGTVTALIGRNGIGKSTLIKTLSGNLKPVGGEVLIDGKRIVTLKEDEMAKIIAVVTTERQIGGALRLEEFVGLGRIPYLGRTGRLKEEDKKIIGEALETVGVGHKTTSYMADLSDGERQKGMIARGLVQDTPIILMDEPFTFLDVAARIEIFELIKRIAKEHNKAVLLSTHEVVQALRMADAIWVMADENAKKSIKTMEGLPHEIISNGILDNLFPDSNVTFDKEKVDFVYKKHALFNKN